jgi:hypothetical protein
MENGIAVLGLIDKYNPLAGVCGLKINGNSHHIDLKCCGTLGLFVEEGSLDAKPVISLENAPERNHLESIRLTEAIGQTQGSVVTVKLDKSLPNLSVIVHL